MEMAEFDRKVERLSKEFEVPETYYEKVDELLETIRKERVVMQKKKQYAKAASVAAAICILITGFFFFSNAKVAKAGFFQTFKQTILDFFEVGESEAHEMGIESKKENAISKPDPMIELQEFVMNTHSIYAVVKVTAPSDVEFKEGMTFDYFGFCEGTAYNADSVVGGSKGCTLLEVLEDKKNVATFVVEIAADKQIEEGKDVTVFFKDLLDGAQYEDDTEILLKGMWSLSFVADYTNKKEITVKGTDDMKFAFAGTTAEIKKIKLTPLGMTFTLDVSNVDNEILYTTDNGFIVSMKMIDGKEVIISSPDIDTDCLADSGTISHSEKKGRDYLKYVYEFRKAIDINQVIGITISDYYVPLKDYE